MEKMMNYKQKIVELRSQGKTYNEIRKLLGCSISTISYHCGKEQKSKKRSRDIKYINKHPYLSKLKHFKSKKYIESNKKLSCTVKQLLRLKIRKFTMSEVNISVEDIIKKFGENPKCYLTGTPIDIHKPRTYQFDHIQPASRGGTNTIDNLGICTKQANMSKSDMTLEELIEFCKQVLVNHGYNITK